MMRRGPTISVISFCHNIGCQNCTCDEALTGTYIQYLFVFFLRNIPKSDRQFHQMFVLPIHTLNPSRSKRNKMANPEVCSTVSVFKSPADSLSSVSVKNGFGFVVVVAKLGKKHNLVLSFD